LAKGSSIESIFLDLLACARQLGALGIGRGDFAT
jgi:hypothetical protein